MNQQVYGLFNSAINAEQAISALKDHGVSGAEISVVRRSDGSGVPALEHKADSGLTTTSADDVVAGAVKGGEVGLGIGLLAGAAALLVPGFGPILAAGPLWAALGGLVVTTGAGVIGGGVVGLLVDQGLPTDAAARYGNALSRGNILVSVRSPSISTADARMLLSKYGATDIESHDLREDATGALEPPVADPTLTGTAYPAAMPVSTTAAPLLDEDEDLPPISIVATPGALSAANATALDEEDEDIAAGSMAADPLPVSAAGSGLERIGSHTS